MFRADPIALKTWDSDLGIQLLTDGGSSDGTRFFKLVGPSINFRFFALARSAPLDRNAEATEWQVQTISFQLPGMTLVETQQVIAEALIAFKDIHGLPKTQVTEALINGTRYVGDVQ